MAFIVPPKPFQVPGGYPDLEKKSLTFGNIHDALVYTLSMDEPLYQSPEFVYARMKYLINMYQEKERRAVLASLWDNLYNAVYGEFKRVPPRERPPLKATLRHTFTALARLRYELDVAEIESTL